MNTLMLGDCLERMKEIPDGSVDMILCDLPYGTTSCRWDVIIPFVPLWKEYRRVAKDNAAIVLTGVQPFTSLLILSNLKDFRHSLVWEKERPTNIFHVKRQIAKVHEDICVFYKRQPTYNPQMVERKFNTVGVGCLGESKTHLNQKYKYSETYDKTKTYPRSVIKINRDTLKGSLHPTQKPVALMEYLIKTYTNKGNTVLDNCMGSGTTGVACVNLSRKFIGIEMDEEYFEIAKKRIGDARCTLDM